MALKYFLVIFLVAIFLFADMVDIVKVRFSHGVKLDPAACTSVLTKRSFPSRYFPKKTSGECDGDVESSMETFCALTPFQTYLAMYTVMVSIERI